jgi:DNA invertase Pin-like site-specific DNA recombinase
MTAYGYVRVSTRDQNEYRQTDAFREYGIPKKNIYTEKISGKDFERPEYMKMIRKLKKGDVLILHSIDRLGRNYKEVLEQWRIITKDKGADIRVLDMPLLDTTKAKDLLGTFIADLVLQLFSFIAENERAAIRRRQAEGIASAKARGVKFGRPINPVPDDFYKLCDCWLSGGITLQEVSQKAGMPRSTFYRKMLQYKKKRA